MVTKDDLKEEYLFLAELHYCPEVGWHPLTECVLHCRKKKKCSLIPSEVRKLRPADILKGGKKNGR